MVAKVLELPLGCRRGLGTEVEMLTAGHPWERGDG